MACVRRCFKREILGGFVWKSYLLEQNVKPEAPCLAHSMYPVKGRRGKRSVVVAPQQHLGTQDRASGVRLLGSGSQVLRPPEQVPFPLQASVNLSPQSKINADRAEV